jgi:hypothetical protein
VRTDDIPALRVVLGELFGLRVTIGDEGGMFDATNVLRS